MIAEVSQIKNEVVVEALDCKSMNIDDVIMEISKKITNVQFDNDVSENREYIYYHYFLNKKSAQVSINKLENISFNTHCKNFEDLHGNIKRCYIYYSKLSELELSLKDEDNNSRSNGSVEYETKSDVLEEEWNCDMCETINNEKDKNCAVCLEERVEKDFSDSADKMSVSEDSLSYADDESVYYSDEEQIDDQPQNMKSDSGDLYNLPVRDNNMLWDCKSCSMKNSINNRACEACYSMCPNFDKWICEKCTFKNEQKAVKCMVCEKENEDIINRAKCKTDDHPQNMKSESEDLYNLPVTDNNMWECKSCSLKNSIFNRGCEACTAISPYFDKWICEKCTFKNEQKAVKCNDCGNENKHIIRCVKCKNKNLCEWEGTVCNNCLNKNINGAKSGGGNKKNKKKSKKKKKK